MTQGIATLGPTAVKFLQWVGTRKDIFPESVSRLAVRYQANVPADPFPFTWLSIMDAIDRDRTQRALNPGSGRWYTLWRTEELDEQEVYVKPDAVGGGSVAQVHAVMIRGLGRVSKRPRWEKAVMKVLRPGVRTKIEADLWWLNRLARCASVLQGESHNWLPLDE
ncbi:putative ubiquinone biosynthesis protein UbiB [Gregarina niphandrodes]|uniref:Ubiquinone biosynthesis protein UbiB n=1 Tax=Gregarina niphandrodes TaxID=110365 RepID=A0A023B8V2_GRENI|nr:putative ubiquinone biosynthesis protein UbiB [Gregarina niphandrodes]EZG70505.1 putative ubiquinone biosynthesis protein UbiB [Gregarina niphandrodes]|eukprot:XP_011129925.1 putative ubiquinone biosynthesis protein UbiB [Gregarina niphandrodes]